MFHGDSLSFDAFDADLLSAGQRNRLPAISDMDACEDIAEAFAGLDLSDECREIAFSDMMTPVAAPVMPAAVKKHAGGRPKGSKDSYKRVRTIDPGKAYL